jgi:hypothetical protein
MVWVDLRRSAVDQMRRVESEEQVRKTVGEVGCQAMEVMAATWPLQVEEGRGGKKKLAEEDWKQRKKGQTRYGGDRECTCRPC